MIMYEIFVISLTYNAINIIIHRKSYLYNDLTEDINRQNTFILSYMHKIKA